MGLKGRIECSSGDVIIPKYEPESDIRYWAGQMFEAEMALRLDGKDKEADKLRDMVNDFFKEEKQTSAGQFREIGIKLEEIKDEILKLPLFRWIKKIFDKILNF
ncbi:MAG: hypothetical protein KAS32_15900 [Candidatus Peribacteraceae bacterium]|nr:hypothetical protein [Candidatus Peribacteraceae bacterium]